MNKQRRKDLAEAIELLDQAKGIIETCATDERDGLDNMPEGLQEGERGQAIEAAADALDYAAEGFDDIITNVNEATGEG